VPQHCLIESVSAQGVGLCPLIGLAPVVRTTWPLSEVRSSNTNVCFEW
jgi:hypothetical protein